MLILNDNKLEKFVYKSPTNVNKLGNPRNERDNLISEFTAYLIDEWKPFYYDSFKKKHLVQPWTLKRVAIKLSYIKSIEDLYYLLSVCKSADSFTKMFNYLTKIRTS